MLTIGLMLNTHVYAASSGVDPYANVQEMLTSPSDSTRQSVIEMTRSIFNKPYATYSPEIYAPSSQEGDLSKEYLGQLFGTVPGVLENSSTTLLSQMFYVFNMGVFAVVTLVLSTMIMTTAVNTGAQGQFMGRKNQTPYWVWFRSFMGVSILMPTYNGYSLIQVVIIWVAVQGVNLCNSIWSEVQNTVYNTNSILSYVKLVDSETNKSVAGVTPIQEATTETYDRCLYNPDSEQCTSSGNFLSHNPVNDALSLTQMLLTYQACISYNLQIWEEQYQACMAVAGNYDDISCYPPKRENLYAVNYELYTITYTGPSKSSKSTTVYPCGDITMTPNCANKSSCNDYQAEYDKNMFDAFLTLFNAAEVPAGDIFGYYNTCANDDGKSCSDPPNNETASNCISANNKVDSSNCPITKSSIDAMNTLVEKVISYQMKYANDETVTGVNTGSMGTGIDDPLGFPDGGWIMAGNAYGSMVYFGASKTGSSLPAFNTFTTSFLGTTLPSTLENSLNYIRPKSDSAISNMSTGTASDPALSLDSTLQKSMLDWSATTSAEEIDEANKETSNAANSASEAVTGYPITACLTGDYFYDSSGEAVACNSVMGGEAPTTNKPSVGHYNCGENDYSIRYLSCIVSYNIKKNDLQGYPFAIGPTNGESKNNQKSWSHYLPVAYDFSVDMGALSKLEGFPDWQNILGGYLNNIQSAWVVAMFGGTDVSTIVDPINRMRMLGIKLIQYSTDYVGKVIKDTMEFVQNIVWSFYFGYFMAQILIWMILNVVEYAVGGGLSTAITTLFEIMEILIDMLADPFTAIFAAIALAIVIGIWFAVATINAVLNTAFNVLNNIFEILAMLFPMLAQMVVLSATQYLAVYLAIAIPVLVLGGYLAGYLALFPYLVFLVTIAGWFLLVLESAVAAPMIALGVTYPQGHDFFGRAEQLMSMFLSIFLRPAGILIGFVFSIIMASMSLFLMNEIFFPVIVNFVGYGIGSSFLSGDLTSFFQGTSSALSYSNFSSASIIDTFIYFGLMLLYAYVASTVLVQCFSLTYMIPYQLTKWVDPRAAESVDEVRGSMDEIKQSFVGEVIAGMANAITSLFALSSMFMQMTHFTPSGGRLSLDQDRVLDQAKNDDTGVNE